MKLVMAPALEVVRENERELVFAYRHPLVWLAFGVGTGMVYLAWATELISNSTVIRGWIGFGGLAMALLALGGIFYCRRLSIDLLARSYTQRSGYWPHTRVQTGSLEELQAVALQVEYRPGSKGTQHPYWVLYLVFKSSVGSVGIASFRNESPAYTRLASLTKTLHVAAIDRTGDQEKTTVWEDLDRPLDLKAQSKTDAWGLVKNQVPPLPVGTRIELRGAPPAREILLPKNGFNVAIFIFLFFAFVPLWMAYGGMRHDLAGGEVQLSTWILATVLVLIGLFFLLVAAFAPFARNVIVESASQLSFGRRVFSWVYGLKSVVKNSIAEILVKPAPNLGSTTRRSLETLSKGFPQPVPLKHEVFVRSGDTVFRIGGSLRRDEQEWLRQALLSMAGERDEDER